MVPAARIYSANMASPLPFHSCGVKKVLFPPPIENANSRNFFYLRLSFIRKMPLFHLRFSSNSVPVTIFWKEVTQCFCVTICFIVHTIIILTI